MVSTAEEGKLNRTKHEGLKGLSSFSEQLSNFFERESEVPRSKNLFRVECCFSITAEWSDKLAELRVERQWHRDYRIDFFLQHDNRVVRRAVKIGLLLIEQNLSTIDVSQRWSTVPKERNLHPSSGWASRWVRWPFLAGKDRALRQLGTTIFSRRSTRTNQMWKIESWSVSCWSPTVFCPFSPLHRGILCCTTKGRSSRRTASSRIYFPRGECSQHWAHWAWSPYHTQRPNLCRQSSRCQRTAKEKLKFHA